MTPDNDTSLQPSDRVAANGRKRSWYLATSQLNLLYMLAGGLITGPAGFGRKYFADPLAVAPGWIPLFADRVPASALAQSVVEGEHLRALVAELDLTDLSGPVQALDLDGSLRPAHLADGLNGREGALLVPAPLPAHWISRIHFANKAEQQATESEAADYAYVPLRDYKRKVSPKLFAARQTVSWPPNTGLPTPRDQPLQRITALGGAMALIHALTDRDDTLITASRLLFDPDRDADEAPERADQALLGAIRGWALAVTDPPGAQDIQGTLVISMLDALVAPAAAGVDTAAEPRQAVLDRLAREAAGLDNDKQRSLLKRLSDDLEGILGIGASTVSELFEQHPRPFSRAMILFFLRDHADELLDLRETRLKPMDLALAALLFGARDGWMGMPPALRAQLDLRNAIAHRMAALAQRLGDSGLGLGPAPARPSGLRESFLTPTWRRAHQDAALILIRGLGRQALLKTRISLGKGNYRLQVGGGGVDLLLDGDVKAVNVEVQREDLFLLLAEQPIPEKLRQQTLAALGTCAASKAT